MTPTNRTSGQSRYLKRGVPWSQNPVLLCVWYMIYVATYECNLEKGVPQNPPRSATRGSIHGEVLTTFPPARTEMSTQAYEWNREHKLADATMWILWSINLLQPLV